MSEFSPERVFDEEAEASQNEERGYSKAGLPRFTSVSRRAEGKFSSALSYHPLLAETHMFGEKKFIVSQISSLRCGWVTDPQR